MLIPVPTVVTEKSQSRLVVLVNKALPIDGPIQSKVFDYGCEHIATQACSAKFWLNRNVGDGLKRLRGNVVMNAYHGNDF